MSTKEQEAAQIVKTIMANSCPDLISSGGTTENKAKTLVTVYEELHKAVLASIK